MTLSLMWRVWIGPTIKTANLLTSLIFCDSQNLLFLCSPSGRSVGSFDFTSGSRWVVSEQLLQFFPIMFVWNFQMRFVSDSISWNSSSNFQYFMKFVFFCLIMCLYKYEFEQLVGCSLIKKSNCDRGSFVCVSWSSYWHL